MRRAKFKLGKKEGRNKDENGVRFSMSVWESKSAKPHNLYIFPDLGVLVVVDFSLEIGKNVYPKDLI